MPFKPRRPAGGFRVMYEYANRLSLLGYSVHVTYPIKTQFMKYRLPYWFRVLLSYIEGFKTNRWFKFNPDISMSYVPSVKDRYIIDADVVFVTWWATALEVGRLSKNKGLKINLIQGFENWTGREDMLYSSYNMPRTVNVVVASYLKEIVNKYTENRTEVVFNAVDNNLFYLTTPIQARSKYSLGMIYSDQEIKGSKYGLEALEIVKKKYPELNVVLFGVCPEPQGLPEWIKYYRNPSDLGKLHNQNAIFIANSLTEGFSLVSIEAMACGCALVCTDIPGHWEYALDKKTALLVPPKDSKAMAEKISYLIDHDKERIEMAERGYLFSQEFSWDISVKKMDKLLKEILNENSSIG